jgi:nitrile hydratase subunit beta
MSDLGIVPALGELALFHLGDPVRVSNRSPIGHYRAPTYLRGKRGSVEKVIEPVLVDNEEEGYGRNAGSRRHYYRIAFAMTEIWPNYAGSPRDGLRIEMFESWLERI